MTKDCVLYDHKICDNCGECEFCDLDPKKTCDNCCKCLDSADYNGVAIDSIVNKPISDEKARQLDNYISDDSELLVDEHHHYVEEAEKEVYGEENFEYHDHHDHHHCHDDNCDC